MFSIHFYKNKTFLPLLIFAPMTDYKRILVTAALPYANGPIHIGHLAGCYLPADIYVRYQREQKRDVKLIGGSDEHGVPIQIRAMKEGITPQQVVDKYHAMIKDSLQQMGISFDIYSRPLYSKIHLLAHCRVARNSHVLSASPEILCNEKRYCLFR